MEQGMTYLDYDKISDDLCWLGKSIVVRMVVGLSNKYNNERKHFHKEYGYESNFGTLYTIRRSFSYYISIDHLHNKESVIISIRDILLLRMKINDAFRWFSDGTFAIKKDNLIITDRKKCIIDGLTCKKEMMLEPIIIEDEQKVQSQGIRMTLVNTETYSDIHINAFAGFVYLMNQIDMYTAAQNLINYVGRPEFGTNLYTFENPNYGLNQPQPENNIKIRELPKKDSNKSFFDRLDDM